MNVLVVIVNYRTPSLTADCLRSLAPEAARVPGTRVIVTDNLSPDDSVEQLNAAIAENGWGDWSTLLPLPKNGGFAYGNNEAIRAVLDRAPDASAVREAAGLVRRDGPPPAPANAGGFTAECERSSAPTPEYVWLLNPDTIVLDGALTELVAFLDSHPDAGIAGGRAENRDGTVRRSSFRFHSPLGELEQAAQFGPVSKALKSKIVAPGIPDAATKVDWVSGASMLVRREVFEKIGLLDDGYFMYFEETDFCLRAARAGFGCWYVPASRIIHLVGQSSGVTGAAKAKKRRPKYWFESRRRFFANNFGRTTLHAANLSWLAAYPIGRAWQLLRAKRPQDPPRLWWDFLRYNYFPHHR